MNNPIQEFRDAALVAGVVLPLKITPSGTICRCGTISKPRGQDGAYSFVYAGDLACGGFQNWASGEGWESWHEGTATGRTLTPTEQAALHAELKRQALQHEAEEKERQAGAAAEAGRIWSPSKPCSSHPYLTKKGVQSHGLRQDGKTLIVPLCSPEGKLASLQYIDPAGNKRFLTGGRKKGCSFMLGRFNGGTLCIAEGYATAATIHESTGYPVVVAFDAGNLPPVAQALRALYPEADLVVCADDDFTRGDNPGITKARAAALAVKGRVAVPDFGNARPDGATDFNDMAQAFGVEAVRLCIENAPAEAVTETTAEAVERLAALPPLEYERVRKAEAAALDVRIVVLDAAVKDARGIQQPAQGSGHALTFPTVEPWDEPVVVADLLDELYATIHRFIICDPDTYIAAVLWAVFTWFIDSVQVAPIAAIISPEKRCGKTQLLDLFSRLTYRPLVASNISPAAVFRVIEAHSPTLLIDEADSFLKDNEPMRGVLNSGHTRQSAFVIRTEGDNFEPRQFGTWGAKAIASIGALQATIMDRSIVLPLRRKLSTESVQRLRHADPDHFKDLVRKLARLVEDQGETMRKARPDLPDKVNDRAQDCWEPLLAIADLAGGNWPQRARAAALNLSGAEREAMSTATELLGDIREAFGQQDRISTEELLNKLTNDNLKPWGNYAHGRPLNARNLSKRLKEFSIESHGLKYPGNVVKQGYRLAHFQDAFDRYLTPPGGCAGSATAATTSAGADLQVADQRPVADRSATGPKPKVQQMGRSKRKY